MKSSSRTIKHITFILPQIGYGGAERVASVLASTLAEEGYAVDLIVYARTRDEYPVSDKVNICLLPERKAGQNKISYLVSKFCALRKLFRDLKPDILVPFLPYQVEHCYYASRGLGIPMVVTVRNNPMYDTDSDKQRKRRDYIAKKVEGVFLQSDYQKDYFPEDILKKSFVVANPVSDGIVKAQYHPSAKVEKIVSVGRLEEQKNFPMLLRAFAIAAENRPELSLDIYGAGSLKEELNELISQLKLDGRVFLRGRTDCIDQTLCQYDLFILPSDFEGMPNSLMEAMGVGLPCISTDCPTGPKELLGDGQRGILVEMNNAEQMAEAIDYMCAHESQRIAFSEAARDYIFKHHERHVIAQRLVEMLTEVIN